MLETIAGRCPLSDGEAVLQARALLALAHAAPRVYHDESNCISERNGAVKTETMGLIRIYPNPVTDEAIVEYAPANNSEQILLIFNTLGQLVRRVELPENPLGKTAISLKNLPEGLYLFRNYNGPMRINSGKIIVNR